MILEDVLLFNFFIHPISVQWHFYPSMADFTHPYDGGRVTVWSYGPKASPRFLVLKTSNRHTYSYHAMVKQ